MKISIVVAVSKNNVIGKEGKIPWRIPEELALFKRITSGHHILMGRKTYESIGKPLAERTNIVLTRDKSFQAEGCFIAYDLDEAIEFARQRGEEELMVIGGEEIYKLTLPFAERIYISRIQKEVEGDSRFPELEENEWVEISRDLYSNGEISFQRRTLERK